MPTAYDITSLSKARSAELVMATGVGTLKRNIEEKEKKKIKP